MRKLFFALTAALVGLAGISGAQPGQAAAQAPTGIWSNPKNSVHVRIRPCADQVCGTVVWANDRARAKAQKAGTPRLVGTELFREFESVRPGYWRGRVFVPDMGKTFSGSLRQTDQGTIVARGCLVAGLLCKSQTWRKIG